MSDWLKRSLIEAIDRDPVAAAKDADVLRSILNLRAEALQRGAARAEIGAPGKTGN